MNLYSIISSSVLIVTQLIFSCQAVQSKCYECSNVCCESVQGKAREFCAYFNETCKDNCVKFPFQHDDKSLALSTCSKPDEMCFTADGLMKYKIKLDDSVFTIRYVQRGCSQTCPVEVCDLSNLKECNFSPEVTRFIEIKVNKERDALIKKIHETFGGEDNVVNYGMGGELRCCSGEGCNTNNETKIAHTYIKDEL